MTLEDILTAQLQATKESNSLLRQPLAATAGDIRRIQDAAKQLGMCAETIRRRIQERKYTAYRDGRIVCVSLSEIRQKMEAEGK
jgi:excisionase family DNA binding protein